MTENITKQLFHHVSSFLVFWKYAHLMKELVFYIGIDLPHNYFCIYSLCAIIWMELNIITLFCVLYYIHVFISFWFILNLSSCFLLTLSATVTQLTTSVKELACTRNILLFNKHELVIILMYIDKFICIIYLILCNFYYDYNVWK